MHADGNDKQYVSTRESENGKRKIANREFYTEITPDIFSCNARKVNHRAGNLFTDIQRCVLSRYYK